MPLPVDLTYNTLISHVKTWILSNCSNFSQNFTNIPAVFKAGYSTKKRYKGNDTANSNYRINIVKYISSVDQSVLETDFTNFINEMSLSDKLESIIRPSEFFNLTNNIISFCASKLYLATSQYNTQAFIIYTIDSNPYQSIQKIMNTDLKGLIKSTDSLNMLNAIITIIKQNIRPYVCTYSITLF